MPVHASILRRKPNAPNTIHRTSLHKLSIARSQQPPLHILRILAERELVHIALYHDLKLVYEWSAQAHLNYKFSIIEQSTFR